MNIKNFNVRMPMELWVFLKQQSLAQEKPMIEIIVDSLVRYKKNIDKKKLTDRDAGV